MRLSSDSRTGDWAEPTTWFMLFAVAGPTWIDLWHHVATRSWTWYVFALVPTTVVAVLCTKRRRPDPMAGVLLLTAGMALLLWAMASGTLRAGRLGFLVGAAGVLLLYGRADGRTLLLLGLCVPVPSLVLMRLSDPFLEPAAKLVMSTMRLFGVPAHASGAGVETAFGILFLDERDLGWSAAALGFGLAWFLHRRRPMSIALPVSVLAGGAGIAVSLLATILLSGAGFASDDPEAMRRMRDLVAYGALATAIPWLGRGDGSMPPNPSSPPTTRDRTQSDSSASEYA